MTKRSATSSMAATSADQPQELVESTSPETTFGLGEKIGGDLSAGDVVLLDGGLGAGKTLLAKGILSVLGYDVDEVTSPSFTLVNLYKTGTFDVYHIDLWRLDGSVDPVEAVGLDEIIESDNAVTIIEWADRLGDRFLSMNPLTINIAGDGEDPRQITIKRRKTDNPETVFPFKN